MQLNIKYFGRVAEITGQSEEIIDFGELTLYQLLDIIFEKYPKLETEDFQVAHNKEIVIGNIKITNSEIAILPPFSGG